jgi:cytochrome b
MFVALFVRLSTKAIHLDLVSELYTEAYIAAPSTLHSYKGYVITFTVITVLILLELRRN